MLFSLWLKQNHIIRNWKTALSLPVRGSTWQLVHASSSQKLMGSADLAGETKGFPGQHSCWGAASTSAFSPPPSPLFSPSVTFSCVALDVAELCSSAFTQYLQRGPGGLKSEGGKTKVAAAGAFRVIVLQAPEVKTSHKIQPCMFVPSRCMSLKEGNLFHFCFSQEKQDSLSNIVLNFCIHFMYKNLFLASCLCLSFFHMICNTVGQ